MTLASSSDKSLLANVVMIDGIISLPSKASTTTAQQTNVNYGKVGFFFVIYLVQLTFHRYSMDNLKVPR